MTKIVRYVSVGGLVAIKRTQLAAGKKLASGFPGPYNDVKVKRNYRYDVEKGADVVYFCYRR